jgi:hypothetical protein
MDNALVDWSKYYACPAARKKQPVALCYIAERAVFLAP